MKARVYSNSATVSVDHALVDIERMELEDIAAALAGGLVEAKVVVTPDWDRDTFKLRPADFRLHCSRRDGKNRRSYAVFLETQDRSYVAPRYSSVDITMTTGPLAGVKVRVARGNHWEYMPMRVAFNLWVRNV